MYAVRVFLQVKALQYLRHSSLLLGLAAACVHANAQSFSELQNLADRWLRETAQAAQKNTPGVTRVETSVGSVDTRLNLASCAKVQAYAPTGVQLWGKTRIGLRCIQGATHWNITLPGTVRVFGTAFVMKEPVPAGVVLTESNFVQAEVDWAQELSPVVTGPAPWIGKMASRALDTGQTLRHNMLKPAQAFQAGAQLRVVVRGIGFEIASDAVALSAGTVGGFARIRMDNGRIASAAVVDTKTVQMDL